ncbi:hypothetical protein DL546_002944 [Coniochaeta pulveracea]|uniref:Ecp2 effector protein domain-containing protein n=1 Tax=Coniochaeta pulveracea TaxID=177199 RepID=A0A420XZ07_9PEZI|nr:hypothetical protein DL546_002944 [Coniochaeta pulveracea]
MKLSLFLHRAAVALLASAFHVFAKPVPADLVPARQDHSNPWPPSPWPDKPVPPQPQEWPPPAVYLKRPHLYDTYFFSKGDYEDPGPLHGPLRARSFTPGMGDLVTSGGATSLGDNLIKQVEPRHFCRDSSRSTYKPAVPVVGKPSANIEDCAVLAERLRRRALYYLDYTEFPHPKHKILVRYRSCSIGVQLVSYKDTNQRASAEYMALPFVKAVVMTNQDVAEALFETLVNPATDGKIAPMKGMFVCPDWVTIVNFWKDDKQIPFWVNVQWDVYGDQWDDTSRA